MCDDFFFLVFVKCVVPGLWMFAFLVCLFATMSGRSMVFTAAGLALVVGALEYPSLVVCLKPA